MQTTRRAFTFGFGLTALLAQSNLAFPALAGGIDNSALGQPGFRAHVATYGVVYLLPPEVNAALDQTARPRIRERLLDLGLKGEAETANLPHVTVMHLHSANPGTPAKMLEAMPDLPPVLNVTLKDFYTTEAAKGAGHPWWFDLGVVKEGEGYEAMQAFNTRATEALTPLRDGPLPRVTGPVHAHMSDAGRDLVQRFGVSGVNMMKDGSELRAHNPHNTLVYSMTPWQPPLTDAMNALADELDLVLPDGIPTTFRSVSIVEIGFMGNVLREIYRIDLADGSVTDVANGKVLASLAD